MRHDDALVSARRFAFSHSHIAHSPVMIRTSVQAHIGKRTSHGRSAGMIMHEKAHILFSGLAGGPIGHYHACMHTPQPVKPMEKSRNATWLSFFPPVQGAGELPIRIVPHRNADRVKYGDNDDFTGSTSMKSSIATHV